MGQKDSKYHVGDKVFVRGVRECAYGWNEDMDDLCGCVVTIRYVEWDRNDKQYRYKIHEDKDWTWDDSCFEPETPAELPEFDASANILDLLS